MDLGQLPSLSLSGLQGNADNKVAALCEVNRKREWGIGDVKSLIEVHRSFRLKDVTRISSACVSVNGRKRCCTVHDKFAQGKPVCVMYLIVSGVCMYTQQVSGFVWSMRISLQVHRDEYTYSAVCVCHVYWGFIFDQHKGTR